MTVKPLPERTSFKKWQQLRSALGGLTKSVQDPLKRIADQNLIGGAGLHEFIKKSQKTPKRELRIARNRMQEIKT